MKKFIKDNKVTYYGFAKTAEELTALRQHKASVVPDKKKEKNRKECRGDFRW